MDYVNFILNLDLDMNETYAYSIVRDLCEILF